MKTTKLKALLLTVAITMIAFTFLTVQVSAVSESGTCGKNISYTYDSETCEVVIDGKGPLTFDYWEGSPFYKSDIKSVVINDGITSIGDFVFIGCDNLTKIEIPYSVTSIGEAAFNGCTDLKNIDIPDSVISIGNMAFEGCTGLTNIVIPDSVLSIGEQAFMYCDSLTSAEFYDSVTVIGNHAFSYCDKLINLKLSENLTTIGYESFTGCYSLKSVTIPASVVKIGDGAFAYCKNLKSIIVDKNNMEFVNDENGVLFNKAKTKLIQYPAGSIATYYSIPDTVSDISYRAFQGASNLVALAIPDSVKTIGNYSFFHCSELQEVYYSADEAKWKKVELNEEFNESLTSAKKYYNHGPEHIYSVEITEQATCTNNGTKKYNCLYGDSYYETVPPTDHSYSSSYTVDEEPTCIQEGSKSKHCINDGCTAKTDITEIEKLPHNNDKNITTEATLSENGKVETICSVCGKVSKTATIYYPKTFTLSTTEYTYNKQVKTPSVTVKDSDGKTIKKDNYTVSYESGRKYPGRYTVKITFKGKYSGVKRLYFTIKPRVTKSITAKQTTSSITLSWTKVTGATGYRVYKYNSKTKKYDHIASVIKCTSYNISKLKAGTAYKFKIRAYTKDDGTIWGSYSSVFETATKPATPKITKLTTTKGKAALVWSNVAGESGYQVYYSIKKDSGYKKVASYKTNVVKGSKSKLTSGKKYYFKVRAYKKTSSGTVYSSWSSVKSIKIK